MTIKSRRACSEFQRISKRTVLAMVTPSILDEVSEDDWTITSFDPDTRMVCVDLQNEAKLIHLSFTLPSLR